MMNKSEKQNDFVRVVGIGASAGGLEALRNLFENIKSDTNMAYVVIQHLSPNLKSHMKEFLARHTDMNIIQVNKKTLIRPNNIYLITQRKNMYINGDFLEVTDFDKEKVVQLPINEFFKSLAENRGSDSISIILSGTGTDGTIGISRVYDNHGLVFVQDKETAVFDGMPNSAIKTGKVNFVLKPEEIARIINDYLSHRKKIPQLETAEEEFANTDDYGKIINFIYKKFHQDFTQYKTATIYRRIFRRMRFLNILSLDEYLKVLNENNEEAESLYKDLLIGVTCFFRDKKVFDELKNKFIPELIKSKKGKEFRIWVPACSTGEEAYSIAMIIDEYLNKHNDLKIDYKIFATDVLKSYVYSASTGVFSLESMDQMDECYREKYFTKTEKGKFKVSKDIRKKIVFAYQNILTDPPFTKVDFISCRNFLIYLGKDAQRILISTLHFALNSNGYLLLGSSETPGDYSYAFEDVNRGIKLYKKINKKLPLERHSIIYSPITEIPKSIFDNGNKNMRISEEFQYLRMYSLLLDTYMPSGILINEKIEGLYFFGDVHKYLIPLSGKASFDVLKMIPESLRIIVAAAIQKAIKTGEKTSYKKISYEINEKKYLLEIQVEPLKMKGYSDKLYFVKMIQKKEINKGSEDDLSGVVDFSKESHERIQFLEGELQYTKEVLQTTVEELETSNEELQGSNEELLASNEELQSTNEEVNAVNEELYSLNSEYEEKITELSKMTNDLNNLMEATNIGVLFLDKRLRIRNFTKKAAELFNLIEVDLGRSIGDITDIFVEDLDISDICRNVLKSRKSIVYEVTSVNRESYIVKVIPYIKNNEVVDGIVVTFLDITDRVSAEKNLLNQQKDFIDFFYTLSESTAICRILRDNNNNPEDVEFLTVNPSFENLIKRRKDKIVGFKASEILPGIEKKWIDKIGNVAIKGESIEFRDFTNFCGKDKRWFEGYAFSNKMDQVIFSLGEITKEVKEKIELSESTKLYEDIFDNIPFGMFRCDLNGNVLFANNYLLEKFESKSAKDLDIEIFNFIFDDKRYKLKDLLEKLPLLNIDSSYFKDGEEHLGKTNLVKRFANGETIIDGSFTENTENIKLLNYNKYLAEHDELTGLYNRRNMERILYKEDLNYPLSLILIDMNALKLTNDAFGHEEGDNAIKRVAEALKVQFTNYPVGRVGGDEFLVIAQNTDENELNMKMDRVLNNLRVKKGKFPVSISYGISYEKKKGVPIADIYRNAENKMYESKFSMKADGRTEVLEYLREVFNNSTHETFEHCKLAENIALGIAKELNLSRQEDLDNLKKLAFYHDLGKLTIPEEIINKKSELTREEFEVLKNHTINGYRIASSIPALYPISNGLLHHHERWDGKGYKDGIMAKDLPLLIRIVSVADAYAGMRSDRLYRKALPKEKAKEEIRKESGKQFDPEVVEAFLKCVDEIDR